MSLAEDELRHIGTDGAIGHYAAWNYFQSIDTPANKEFVKKFKAKYGQDRVTGDPIEAAYFHVHMYARAVEKAGTDDLEKVRQALKGLEFDAPGGKVKIDEKNNHTHKFVHIGRILSNGQFNIVWSTKNRVAPDPQMKNLIRAH